MHNTSNTFSTITLGFCGCVSFNSPVFCPEPTKSATPMPSQRSYRSVNSL